MNYKLYAPEFDSIVPVDDLCMALGLVCQSQKRALRHYQLHDGTDLTVNTARNEWAVNNPHDFGSASDLARKFGLVETNDFSNAMRLVEIIYDARENMQYIFPKAVVSSPIWDFTETCHPKNATIGAMITRLGLTMDTVKFYSLEGSLPKVKGQGSERVIAFRCGDDAESFLAFNGRTFRQIGEPGITVFGERRKDQVCMVYENPLDFLALMDSVQRNGVYPVMARRYHIILNGKVGLRKACEYLKANPDFLEVRCFLPSTETGDRYFAAINDAVKGTAINRSDLYCGHGSLLGKYAPRVPESYLNWKAKQKSQTTKSEERIVRHTEAKPTADISSMFGEKRSAVIDRKEGGLKL